MDGRAAGIGLILYDPKTTFRSATVQPISATIVIMNWRQRGPYMKYTLFAAAAGISALTLMACTPSVNVNVNLAPIYAKLDVNVKVQLEEDVKALIKQNPDLF